MRTSVKVVVQIIILGGVFGFFSCSSADLRTDGIYTIGDRGPGGGFIFYIRPERTDGWKYLEAAPEDQSNKARWGCNEITLGVTATIVGTGKRNTQIIVSKCGELGIAAKLCTAYRGGGKSDWFLPDRYELNLMYENLHKAGVGGFADDIYWSSSEVDAFNAWYQDFYNGAQIYTNKLIGPRVRAVRAF